jgi:formylglycine-generating enzyme required for sulfatase activity
MSKPVTSAQYLSLNKSRHEVDPEWTRHPDFPVTRIDWYKAATYCNLLSKEEGVEENQWCYETDAKGQVTKLKADYLSLTGYRLPTEAEMEYAIRAGAVTSRYYGETDELLGNYAWTRANANELRQRVGTKKPNDLGLFDAVGNCFVWCQDASASYPDAKGDGAVEDKERELVVISTAGRVSRGGSFLHPTSYARSAYRNTWPAPTNLFIDLGVRPAKTFAP